MARLADSMYRRSAAVLAATLAIVLTPLAVAAQSEIRVTPDSKRTLINKDVGDERWAITRNPDGSASPAAPTAAGALRVGSAPTAGNVARRARPSIARVSTPVSPPAPARSEAGAAELRK